MPPCPILRRVNRFQSRRHNRKRRASRGQAVQGQDRRRHPRPDAGLGRVSSTRRPRAHPTSSPFPTTTPASLPGRPTADGSKMPTMENSPTTGSVRIHTTALRSPTRSFRSANHRQNGFASISETATGYPGYNLHIPRACASIATVLRDAGWRTFWVGKNHNIPVESGTIRSSRRTGRSGRAMTASTARWAARAAAVPRPRRGRPRQRPAWARGRLPPRRLARPGLESSATRSRSSRTSRGTCGSARGRTTRRITLRRSTSRGTRASSTTGTRRTASGCWRG